MWSTASGESNVSSGRGAKKTRESDERPRCIAKRLVCSFSDFYFKTRRAPRSFGARAIPSDDRRAKTLVRHCILIERLSSARCTEYTSNLLYVTGPGHPRRADIAGARTRKFSRWWIYNRDGRRKKFLDKYQKGRGSERGFRVWEENGAKWNTVETSFRLLSGENNLVIFIKCFQLEIEVEKNKWNSW